MKISAIIVSVVVGSSAIPMAVAQESEVVSGVEIAKYILVSPMEFIENYCGSAVPEAQEALADDMDALRRRIEFAIEPFSEELAGAASMSPEEFAEFKASNDETANFAFSLARPQDPVAYCASFRDSLGEATVDAIRAAVAQLIRESGGGTAGGSEN